jgi:hypothetical protein
LSNFIQRIRQRYGRRRKRGIAAVIGGVIVFAIMFSVGYAYFLTAQLDYKSLQSSNVLANEETLFVTGGVYQGNLTAQVRNAGPITITITSIVIVDQTSGTNYGKTWVLGNNPSTPAENYHNQFPFSLNSQAISNNVTTPVVAGTDYYLVEAITSRGTIATATISSNPAPASQLALQALTSGALGDIYLNFNSYTFYTVSNTVTGCPTTPKYSGYCLTQIGPAFAIPCSNYCSANLAFSVSVTNLNSQQGEIVLDQFSMLYQTFTAQANTKGTPYPFFIISNQSNAGETETNAIYSNYTAVVLQYNKPQTLVFASANCLNLVTSEKQMNDGSACSGFTPFSFPTNAGVASGVTATVFMMSHGWEVSDGTALSSLNPTNTNYGQTSPYETTVYI